MKSHKLSLLALLILPLAGNASSERIVKDSITSQGKERTYYLFVPDAVKASTPAPLIVLLHGSGHNGMSLIEKWTDIARQEGIVIVGPDSINSSQWSSPVDGPDFLHDLVEAVKSKYPINPRRVYLFGHSAGAVFALQVSLLESEYFAATAVHAGALQPQAYSLTDRAKRKIHLAIFVGTKDAYFPLTAVRATRDELAKEGFSVEVSEIPNHDHWYYDLAPKINRSAWDFLKKYELAEDQQYEHYNFKR
jgi:poly(3-hydroxybutyrate) depolymerase